METSDATFPARMRWAAENTQTGTLVGQWYLKDECWRWIAEQSNEWVPVEAPTLAPLAGTVKTPRQWEDYYGVFITAPEGWRNPVRTFTERGTLPPRPYTEEIGLIEFVDRLFHSPSAGPSLSGWNEMDEDRKRIMEWSPYAPE
jgi:hypothetical protein